MNNNNARFNRQDLYEAYWCLGRYIVGPAARDQVFDLLSNFHIRRLRPRPELWRGPKHLTRNGKLIYRHLVREYYG